MGGLCQADTRGWGGEGKASFAEGSAQVKAERCEVQVQFAVGVTGVETGGMARAQTDHEGLRHGKRRTCE